jgi:hypothetical protein
MEYKYYLQIDSGQCSKFICFSQLNYIDTIKMLKKNRKG